MLEAAPACATEVLAHRRGDAGGSVRAKCRVAGGSVLYCAVTEAGAGIPAKVCVRVLRAMLLDVTRPLGRGHRPHRHRYGPGWAHAYRHRPGDISGATPVRTALARVLLSPSLAKAEAAPSPATCLTCRCHLRRLDLSHSRDRRDPYGTSARLASSTGRARAVTRAPEQPAGTLPARSADTVAPREASRRSADTVPLEAAHADVRYTGVPGHGLAARGDHRVSCCLHHRADTERTPAALARAVITTGTIASQV